MADGRAARGGALLAVWLASAAVGAAQQRTNFVGCPIVRDTASVPCWLAEYEGERYFLTLQTDVSAPVTPPWLGHRVLVEGTVSAEPRVCGGIVLKPVHLSVLDRDASCNTMLPAEERYNLTFEPPRPPGPSKGRLAFDTAPAAPPLSSHGLNQGIRRFLSLRRPGRLQPCGPAHPGSGVRPRDEGARSRSWAIAAPCVCRTDRR